MNKAVNKILCRCKNFWVFPGFQNQLCNLATAQYACRIVGLNCCVKGGELLIVWQLENCNVRL